MTHHESAPVRLTAYRRRATVAVASLVLASVATVAGTVATATTATAHPDRQPAVTHLARFGSGLGSGSTIGPDGAIYVTDGVSGSVDRVDRRTGAVTVFATGLPPKVIAIGGAMDLAFLDGRLYVLVTLVGGDIVGGPHLGDATVGVYRLETDGRFTVVADIGSWSVAHPPAPDFFITTGVQYAMIADHGALLVTDGHHNRILRVALGGQVDEVIALADVVPTGLESEGGTIWVAQAGPVPHRPETGRVMSFRRNVPTATPATVKEVARGASLLVDVEIGPRHRLYALSQGQWDGVMEGSPALPDTGRLVRMGSSGTLEPVVGASGAPLVLDRPTSMEFVGRTAYVVSLTGDLYRIDAL
jgi:hypothetical protein